MSKNRKRRSCYQPSVNLQASFKKKREKKRGTCLNGPSLRPWGEKRKRERGGVETVYWDLGKKKRKGREKRGNTFLEKEREEPTHGQ